MATLTVSWAKATRISSDMCPVTLFHILVAICEPFVYLTPAHMQAPKLAQQSHKIMISADSWVTGRLGQRLWAIIGDIFHRWCYRLMSCHTTWFNVFLIPTFPGTCDEYPLAIKPWPHCCVRVRNQSRQHWRFLQIFAWQAVHLPDGLVV